jgi:hypothetical protein
MSADLKKYVVLNLFSKNITVYIYYIRLFDRFVSLGQCGGRKERQRRSWSRRREQAVCSNC